MIEQQLQLIAKLNTVSTYQYYRDRRMPPFVETAVATFLSVHGDSSATLRDQAIGAASSGTLAALGWYARMVAGASVRERSVERLESGIASVGVCVDAGGDPRDAISGMALLWHSASLLGVDPNSVFQRGEARCGVRGGAALRGFAARPQDAKAISASGFAEGRGPLGFDYVPLLPEFGGPSPIG